MRDTADCPLNHMRPDRGTTGYILATGPRASHYACRVAALGRLRAGCPDRARPDRSPDARRELRLAQVAARSSRCRRGPTRAAVAHETLPLGFDVALAVGFRPRAAPWSTISPASRCGTCLRRHGSSRRHVRVAAAGRRRAAVVLNRCAMYASKFARCAYLPILNRT